MNGYSEFINRRRIKSLKRLRFLLKKRKKDIHLLDDGKIKNPLGYFDYELRRVVMDLLELKQVPLRKLQLHDQICLVKVAKGSIDLIHNPMKKTIKAYNLCWKL